MTAMPPHARSSTAMAFTTAAAEGRFCLQKCAVCSHVSYPARDACPKCWSADLRWTDMPPGGTLLADSTLRSSFNPWFKQRLPWRIGLVHLDAGPVVVAHIHRDAQARARVRMIARTDPSGQGVLIALPETDTPGMNEDPQWQALTSGPNSEPLAHDGGGGG